MTLISIFSSQAYSIFSCFLSSVSYLGEENPAARGNPRSHDHRGSHQEHSSAPNLGPNKVAARLVDDGTSSGRTSQTSKGADCLNHTKPSTHLSRILGQAGVGSHKGALTCAVRESEKDGKDVHSRHSFYANPGINHSSQYDDTDEKCIDGPQDVVCKITNNRSCRDAQGVDNKQQADCFDRCETDDVTGIDIDLRLRSANCTRCWARANGEWLT